MRPTWAMCLMTATAALAIASALLYAPQTSGADDTYTEIRRIPFQSGGGVIVVNPENNRLYVAGDKVYVLDAGSGEVLDTIPANAVTAMAINRSTNKLYVGVFGRRLITVDGRNNDVIAEVELGAETNSITINPLTNRVYVNEEGRGVSVIDGSTDTILSHIEAPAGKMTVDPTTNRLYVLAPTTVYGTTNLSIFDGSTDELVDQVEIGVAPFNVSVDPTKDRIYVSRGIDSGAGPGQLMVFDRHSLALLNTIPLIDQITRLGLDASAHILYAANFYTNAVTVFDSSGVILATVAVGAGPFEVAVDEVRHLAYVTHGNDSRVSVIGFGPALATEAPTAAGLPTGGGAPMPSDVSLPASLGAVVLLVIAGVSLFAARRVR